MVTERLPDPAGRRGAAVFNAALWGTAGLATGLVALLALVSLLAVLALCALGIGLFLIRPGVLLLRAAADLERRRLEAAGHRPAAHRPESPAGPAAPLRASAADPAVRREAAWLVLHAFTGTAIGVFFVQVPVDLARSLSYPLWWRAAPGESYALQGMVRIDDWGDVAVSTALSLALAVVWFAAAPALGRLQSLPGIRLLGSAPSAPIVEHDAPAARALEAHAAELRRIERALHDGTQSRLIGAAVLVGAARRNGVGDHEQLEALLGRAQDAVEEALTEVRGVVRSVLPPVLERRGLEGAIEALAETCAVPVSVEMAAPLRCPAAIEATAYFAVAEALANVSQYSRASRARVQIARIGNRLRVRIVDDGIGGADPEGGTGIAGIRRRAESHGGAFTLESEPGGPTAISLELPCG